MTAEQKQRAADLLAAWRATAYALHADRMADLLQELVDAPEAEPVARVTGYYAGYLSISTIDGRVLPAGTALYLAPPAPSVPDGWKLVPYTPTEEMLEQAAYAVNSRPKPSKYEATATPSIIFWNAMLKYSPESTGIKEPPADLVRDAKPDIWRVMCGDWRDKTVAIHNSAGYITCGLDPAKAAVLVRAHNGEMSDGGAAIAEVKGQS